MKEPAMDAETYLWIKALHVMAVLSWMAGLFYLPRLFVYHAMEPVGSATSETFKTMERRLLNAIMTPAAIVVWATGLTLAISGGFFADGWFHAKLTLVVLMTVLHGFLFFWKRDFFHDHNRHSSRFYRFANEVPTLLMIGIVILVIVKP
jgi:protoporphyrinogen IX oxidase